MDPVTQGALGAALPQSVARRGKTGLAMLCGIAGGMAPDLDVIIRSANDPLLFLEYHRQFTHSLIFIPLGAAIVALTLWGTVGLRRGWAFREVYFFTALGYATHAVLDACTSYGTLLFWPFSDQRFAWNNVSIIDPLLTVPLIALVLTSRLSHRRWPALVGMFWVVGYLSLGVVARDAAQEVAQQLAHSRGHRPAVIEAKPSFANLLLWKTIYEDDDRYYVDAVRLGREPVVYPGEVLAALDIARDFPWLGKDSLQARDVERFRWFSMGYIAADPDFPNRIIDIRYSLLPNEIRPLWSIQLNPETQDSKHVSYLVSRERGAETVSRLWTMIRGLPL
ncbi:MAG: inner membrane protein [Glaciecola sp.]|jgi:inner membrane protein|uniref:metal-dependent hydrolase n=1 Tax=Congregibacter sp. TaxID=2744308 RepID=UPI0039E558DA